MKKIIIILGGKSGEHEVSVNSAKSIEKYLDREKYNPSVIGIAPNGSWVSGATIADITKDGKVKKNGNRTLPTKEITDKILSADVIFPIIHGPNGEDGTIQGLLEIANKPYVGSRVLGSAVSMDKVIQKQLCATVGIPQTDYTFFTKTDWENNANSIIEIIEDQLSYPVFVKPANLGSSVGISKVISNDSLKKSIIEALKFDNKIIVENGVTDSIEVEVSVLGNNEPVSSVCGSIVPNTEFYDYETKYVTDDIQAQIPAQIDKDDADTIRELAVEAYKTLNCAGLARVDFFYRKKDQQIFLNEINTLPGFTSISMYPKLWEATDLSYTDLITRLLDLAQENWKERQELKYTY